MESKKPAAQVAINEDLKALGALGREAAGPEDHEYLASVRAELGERQAQLNEERLKALGGKVMETPALVELPNGSIVPETEVKAAQEAGQEEVRPNVGGRVSA
jgi:hypothetical protein